MEPVRFTLALAPDLVSAVDEWRYAQRVPSRMEAIRRLVLAGLEAPHAAPVEVRYLYECSGNTVRCMRCRGGSVACDKRREEVHRRLPE